MGLLVYQYFGRHQSQQVSVESSEDKVAVPRLTVALNYVVNVD